MEQINTLPKPAEIAVGTKLFDFKVEDKFVRVVLELNDTAHPDHFFIKSKALEMTFDGHFVMGPQGKPSATETQTHTVQRSGIGRTQSLKPSWVHNPGDYTPESFEPSADKGNGKPVDLPTEGNTTKQYLDLESGLGYKYVDGLQLTIARGRVEDLLVLLANSNTIAGLDF